MNVNQSYQSQGPAVSREYATCLDVLGTSTMLGMGSKNQVLTGVILVAGATPIIGTIIGLGRIIYGYSLLYSAKGETNLQDRQVKEIIAKHHIDHGCRELIPGYLAYKIFKFAQDDAAPNRHPSRDEMRELTNKISDKLDALEKTITDNNVEDPMQLPQWKGALIELHNAHVNWYDNRESILNIIQRFV